MARGEIVPSEVTVCQKEALIGGWPIEIWDAKRTNKRSSRSGNRALQSDEMGPVIR